MRYGERERSIVTRIVYNYYYGRQTNKHDLFTGHSGQMTGSLTLYNRNVLSGFSPLGTLYTVQCTLCTVQCTLYTLYSIKCTAKRSKSIDLPQETPITATTVYIVQCTHTIYTVHCVCTVYIACIHCTTSIRTSAHMNSFKNTTISERYTFN